MPIHDALGSVLGGINSSGAFQYQYTYDAFGNFTTSGQPPSGCGNVYGMAGIEIDPTGLYHANARYYSPALTRFVSEDPQRGKANMFTYAGNGPIGNSDISGMSEDGGGFCICYLAPIIDLFIFEESTQGSATAPREFVALQDKAQLGQTYEMAGISPYRLTLSQIGNIVFNETRGMSGDDLDEWRINIAHVIINGAARFGADRPTTAPDTTATNLSPDEQLLVNETRSAAIAAQNQTDYGIDPTNGALHFNTRTTKEDYPWRPIHHGPNEKPSMISPEFDSKSKYRYIDIYP